jgi:hypothetical protein
MGHSENAKNKSINRLSNGTMKSNESAPEWPVSPSR